MKTKNPYLSLGVSFFMVLNLCACLQTRAQLRNTPDDASNDSNDDSVPARVTDARPRQEYVIDEIKGELTRLSGRIEEMERARQNAESQNMDSGEELKRLQTRLDQLEQNQNLALESLRKLEQRLPPPDPDSTFKTGKELFQGGNYQDAADAFSEYLKTPRGRFAEEATFMRAESLFNLQKYKQAILDYSTIGEKFRNSKHHPTALYRIGLSFEAMGMKTDALAFYREIVEKFPKSPEAKLAKTKSAPGGAKSGEPKKNTRTSIR